MISDKKILIVEDDAFLVKIIANRLTEEGFETEIANDGEEALAKMMDHNYALAILDLVMPNKNGFEVLQELKKHHRYLPILVFTNLSQEDDKQMVMSLGAKGYYVKSDISIDEMIRLVRDFLPDRMVV